MLTGETKQSFDFKIIESELKEKYLFNDEDQQNKAITQLSERIKLLFEGSVIYDENYNANNIRIYPLLIVSELAITTPGMNVVFNQWFRNEINKTEILRNNCHRIYDLVILDIDTLILYSERFEKQNGLFEQCINAYYSAIDRKKIKPKHGVPPTTEYFESLMVKTYQPFNGFIKDYLSVKTPDIFMEFGGDILK